MASTRMLAIMPRLRYDSALSGHAMPFGGMEVTGVRQLCIKLTISGPDFVVCGIGVPISRGSPPFFDEC